MCSGCNSDQKGFVQTLSIDSSKAPSTDSVIVKTDTIKAHTIGKPYFDFDEVIHYNIPMSDEHFDELIVGEKKTPYQKALFDVLRRDHSGQMIDSLFWYNLNSIKKTKKLIKNKYFKEFNSEIFVEKECSPESVGCIAVFRDILVFKKKNAVIGLAKICFKCHMFHIEGSNSSTECFGMNGEYKMLEKIFEENRKL